MARATTTRTRPDAVAVSIIVPTYDERANIATLTGEENIVTAPGANAFECREYFWRVDAEHDDGTAPGLLWTYRLEQPSAEVTESARSRLLFKLDQVSRYSWLLTVWLRILVVQMHLRFVLTFQDVLIIETRSLRFLR